MAHPSAEQRSRTTEMGANKLTGWPRPAMRFGESVGLNPLRMAVLLVLALTGIGGGYVIGKYLAPVPPPAEPPLARTEPKQLPPTYEQQLPRDIVFESNGVLTRIALPEPDQALDLGNYRAPVPKNAADTEKSPNAASSETKPTTNKPKPEAAPETSDETIEVARRPVPELIRAMPDDIAERQRLSPGTLPTWQRYAQPVSLGNKPKIVLVMDDLGLDRRRTRRTWQLPGPLTLSFMAYAQDINQQSGEARSYGHELMLHVPMEPSSQAVDPGPNVLLSGMATPELRETVAWNLDQTSGYVGINNHMGSRFTSDNDAMRTVIGILKERGLMFLDSVTASDTVAHDVARAAGIPFAVRNVFLDHDDDVTAIRRQLDRVERIAENKGLAIAIGHPREHTLEALEPWLKDLEARGFQLVPISAVARIAPGN